MKARKHSHNIPCTWRRGSIHTTYRVHEGEEAFTQHTAYMKARKHSHNIPRTWRLRTVAWPPGAAGKPSGNSRPWVRAVCRRKQKASVRLDTRHTDFTQPNPFTPKLKNYLLPTLQRGMYEVVRIGSIIISHLSKLWKAKSSHCAM